MIEKLLAAPEFKDKWSVWLTDLVGMTESPSTGNRRPQIEGRNAFHGYIQHAVESGKPLKAVAYELITAKGNNYYSENGPASYPVLGSAAMGPIQDTYDLMLFRTATAFLGLAHYDCLLCHNGRGHLEQLSLWAARGTRLQAQRMAAHFARMRLNGAPNTKQYEHPLYNSTDVQDAATGTYDLNTNFGNRPGRCANGLPLNDAGRCTATQSITPEYRDGAAPKDGNWRAAFAGKMIEDPLFGINLANRLWKEFFGLGLVDPVDTLDPDRLDPTNPPPAPWALQASHPELLAELGRHFFETNTDLRGFIRTLVSSSAYQLSSRYDAPWKIEYVPLFARHYPRRLKAEEVHDAVVKSTGMVQRYTYPIVNGQTIKQGSALPQSEAVEWAMQLPDINEPRNNAGNGNTFMSAFHRGNRDTAQRSSAGSILQQLNVMNDQFVTNRIKLAASPVLREIAKNTDNGGLVDQLFLNFLSRRPSEVERTKGVEYLGKQTTASARNTAIEDLAWVCINKIDFLFSY